MSSTAAEAERKHRDLIDIVLEAVREPAVARRPDGTEEIISVTNNEILWWKTLVVGSEVFARLALELKEWERMAEECYYNMEPERAAVLAAEIKGIANSYKRSIDAKSSESSRGDNIVTATLIDRVNKSNIDKTLHVEGAPKSMAAKLLGREEDGDV